MYGFYREVVSTYMISKKKKNSKTVLEKIIEWSQHYVLGINYVWVHVPLFAGISKDFGHHNK